MHNRSLAVALTEDPAQVAAAVMDDIHDALPVEVQAAARAKVGVWDAVILACWLQLTFSELERKGCPCDSRECAAGPLGEEELFQFRFYARTVRTAVSLPAVRGNINRRRCEGRTFSACRLMPRGFSRRSLGPSAARI